MDPILISNSFPFSLVRRQVVAEPRSVGELLTAMHERPWVSVWGHANTVKAASAIAGADLRPKTERPSLVLSEDRLPTLDGQAFTECWILSPNFAPGFRPAIGEEVPEEEILGWEVLRLEWTEKSPVSP